MALHHDIIPYIKPAEMLAWYATNPLLVAAYPQRCALRASQSEAGSLSNFEISKLAQGMTSERLRLRLKLTNSYEGTLGEQPEWQRIQELLQASQIDRQERSSVLAFARQAHTSEWPWLIKRMEEVITRRALAEGYEFALAA
jgi:hypothetical protein